MEILHQTYDLIRTDFLSFWSALTTDTQLLDLSPGGSFDSQIDAADSALKLTGVFEDPGNGVYLQVVSVTPELLTVCLGESVCNIWEIVPAASTWGLSVFALSLLIVGSVGVRAARKGVNIGRSGSR